MRTSAMTVRTTAKSVIYSFDGYSSHYRAVMQGAPIGEYIVPSEHVWKIPEGDEHDWLRMAHRELRHLKIIRRKFGHVQ